MDASSALGFDIASVPTLLGVEVDFDTIHLELCHFAHGLLCMQCLNDPWDGTRGNSGPPVDEKGAILYVT